jgi:hypothetical protein
MDAEKAARLVRGLRYRPGDAFEAAVVSPAQIAVVLEFQAYNSTPGIYQYYDGPGTMWSPAAVITVAGLDELGVLRSVEKIIEQIDAHERREFLRSGASAMALFHPHHRDAAALLALTDEVPVPVVPYPEPA